MAATSAGPDSTLAKVSWTNLIWTSSRTDDSGKALVSGMTSGIPGSGIIGPFAGPCSLEITAKKKQRP